LQLEFYQLRQDHFSQDHAQDALHRLACGLVLSLWILAFERRSLAERRAGYSLAEYRFFQRQRAGHALMALAPLMAGL
jgi:hypothetical protein